MNDLLPPNRTPLEALTAQTIAEATALAVEHHTLWDPDTCPEDVLPWLAWAVGVAEWSADWPESQRRAVVGAAIARRRRLGTVQSARESVEAVVNMGIDGLEFAEWFEYGGRPGTFRIVNTVAGRVMNQAQYDQIINVLHRSCRLSAWPEMVGWSPESYRSARPAMAGTYLSTVTVYPYSEVL